MLAIKDIFSGDVQPKGFTRTMLILVPKKEGASKWNNFPPISLCNVSSKILSKILANRINGVSPKIIHLTPLVHDLTMIRRSNRASNASIIDAMHEQKCGYLALDLSLELE